MATHPQKGSWLSIAVVSTFDCPTQLIYIWMQRKKTWHGCRVHIESSWLPNSTYLWFGCKKKDMALLSCPHWDSTNGRANTLRKHVDATSFFHWKYHVEVQLMANLIHQTGNSSSVLKKHGRLFKRHICLVSMYYCLQEFCKKKTIP